MTSTRFSDLRAECSERRIRPRRAGRSTTLRSTDSAAKATRFGDPPAVTRGDTRADRLQIPYMAMVWAGPDSRDRNGQTPCYQPFRTQITRLLSISWRFRQTMVCLTENFYCFRKPVA